MAAGTLVAVHVTPARGAAVVPSTAAVITDDWGIDGDHHARPGSSRQVVLVTAEILDALHLESGTVREQLCIRGPGETATGDAPRLGSARLEVTGPSGASRLMGQG